jgi:hypothetical protein
MFGITFLSTLLLGAAAVSAVPTHQFAGCSTAKANIASTFPAGQSTLTATSGAPSFVGKLCFAHHITSMNIV